MIGFVLAGCVRNAVFQTITELKGPTRIGDYSFLNRYWLCCDRVFASQDWRGALHGADASKSHLCSLIAF